MESCWCWYGAEKKMIDILNETNKDIYPGIFSILSIFLTMPVSSASSERSFSAMRRIKNYLRTTMRDERLSNLSLLHVQRLMSIDTVAVIIEKQKNEFYLKQTKIKLCSVVGYYRFLLFDLSRKLIECSVNWFYSLIIINYGTTYNVSFWYHTTKYINVLNYALQLV